MVANLTYSTVRDTKRQPIYVLRVHNTYLDYSEIDQLSARMSQWLSHRGQPTADIVVVQGASKETLRLSGSPYAVKQVRAAMFNAELRWTPIVLG